MDFMPGTHISEAARLLCERAKRDGVATGNFNDVTLRAGIEVTPEDIVAFYDREMARLADEYRRSPEGIAAAKRDDDERRQMQGEHDALVARLPALDMHDQHAVLDWICAMQEPSDRKGVIVKRETIVAHFEKAGYQANENTGPAYDGSDRKNSFRYLVGQALAGLKDGPAIHPIIHKFAGEWRERFTPELARGAS